MTIHKVDQRYLSKTDQFELFMGGALIIGICLLGLIWN